MITFIELIFGVGTIIGMWGVFQKAGHPGWAAIIPIYNFYILTKIVNRPSWWTVMCLIPFVNLIFIALIYMDLAKCFGKSSGYPFGLYFLGFIFFPMLGFGSSIYRGNPNGAPPNPFMAGSGSNAPTRQPPGWLPDPTGRHQFRYWDATRWSEHVSDNSVQSVDPL